MESKRFMEASARFHRLFNLPEGEKLVNCKSLNREREAGRGRGWGFILGGYKEFVLSHPRPPEFSLSLYAIVHVLCSCIWHIVLHSLLGFNTVRCQTRFVDLPVSCRVAKVCCQLFTTPYVLWSVSLCCVCFPDDHCEVAFTSLFLMCCSFQFVDVVFEAHVALIFLSQSVSDRSQCCCS